MRGGLGRGSEGSSMDRDSLEDFTAEELLVLATEDIQGQLDNLDIAGEEEDDASCSDTKSLIVTNVDLVVFTEPLAKAEFESRFSVFDPDIIFYYIRTFRRYSSLNFQKPVCKLLVQGKNRLQLPKSGGNSKDIDGRRTGGGEHSSRVLAPHVRSVNRRRRVLGSASSRETVPDLSPLFATCGLGAATRGRTCC